MTIGVYTFEIHLPGAQSLKNKRQVLRRVKDRLRSRYNVAVSELEEHADLWQRASLAVVSVASRREPLERLFEAVRDEAQSHVPGEIIDTGSEFIDGIDGGPGGWNEDWE
ncbi:hypothetical protein ABI59_24050 [Acidobacteria bacterium Mor1]|nr:hypothetical protein ABI59_24050 [Acidobacteria bacterium Mor1]